MTKREEFCNQFLHVPPLARQPTVCEIGQIMQTQDNVIRTTMDPKEFRAKYPRLAVIDGGEFETRAATEVINEGYDPATKTFTMQVALYYPRRSTRNVFIEAVPVWKDGKTVGIKPPDYMMTQANFDAAVRDEKFNVPALY